MRECARSPLGPRIHPRDVLSLPEALSQAQATRKLTRCPCSSSRSLLPLALSLSTLSLDTLDTLDILSRYSFRYSLPFRRVSFFQTHFVPGTASLSPKNSLDTLSRSILSLDTLSRYSRCSLDTLSRYSLGTLSRHSLSILISILSTI